MANGLIGQITDKKFLLVTMLIIKKSGNGYTDMRTEHSAG